MKLLKDTDSIKLKTKFICLIILFIGFITFNNIRTYSWFSVKKEVQISSSVATTEDFITVGEVINESPDPKLTIPAYIKITKNCSQDINASFELQGEVAQFLSPIAPTKLINKETTIPITTILTLENYLAMSRLFNANGKKDKMLAGTISVKCYNKFIKEDKDIKISLRYLMIKTVIQ
ncbi:hypothetical protein NBE98_13080 [Clostridium swellfunianum]|uniref:hypothetical protein n=1 Tax=Clostridium swellfunianum TaxID=1367462 RepID=UPI00202EC4B4|nr:hypothetical protein [Clostridium swellfunianum]MCM0649305.1 hypothetical protein [Clostridium swellfunianum]